MTQHPEFLKTDYMDYAAECRRIAALARPQLRNSPTTTETYRRLAERAARVIGRYRQPHEGIALAAKQPAYS
jgi:hypothetical protein